MTGLPLIVFSSEICLVACHTWDTLGAVAAGWEAALILRPGNALLDVGPQPQITGADLSEVADKLTARHANQYHAALNPIADIAAGMPPNPGRKR